MIRKDFIYSGVTANLKLISGFFLLIVIARMISVNEFAAFMYALTYATIFGLFVDYGYQIKLLKEVSENTDNIPYLVSRSLLSKSLIFVISLLLFSISLFLLSFTEKEVILAVLLFLGYIFGSFGNSILIIYKCTNRFSTESKYVFIDTIVLILLMLFISLREVGSVEIAFVFMLSKLIYLLFVLYRYKTEYGFVEVSMSESINDLKVGVPFAVHFIVGNLYLNVDTLIIKEFSDMADVAMYQSGIRLIIGAGILLTVLNSVLTPRFVRFKVENKSKLYREVNYSIRSILLLGLLGIFLVFNFSKEIAVMIYGEEYVGLGALLPIFSIIILLRTLGAVYGILLTIGGGQKTRAISVLGTLLLVIVLDIIFAPTLGIVGAAYVLLAAHILLTLIYLINVRKLYSSYFILK